MKKDFDDCICLIESEKIRDFVKKALKLAPTEFWKAPCSSSGKHHPPEDNFEGGIIIHSRKTVQVALALFRFFDIKDRLAQDKIIAACILHDITKNGTPWGESTDYEHGEIAVLKLFPSVRVPDEKGILCLVDPDLLDVLILIKNHMGIWSHPKPTPAFENGEVVTAYSVWHLIVQLSDYWGSQPWCPFVCDEFNK